MDSYWKSREFKKLNHFWQKKLEDSGFQDQEDKKERLKQYDRRTIGFENRQMISDYFSRMGSYLETCEDIPDQERLILELYCQGIRIKEIAIQIKKHRRTVEMVIRKHKLIVLCIA